MKQKKYLWGILVTEEESEEGARKTAESMANCPHLIAIGTSSNFVYSVYMVSEDKRWWLEYPLKMNEKLGREKYRLQIVENSLFPDKPPHRVQRYDEPPCGADCVTCKLKDQYGCDGCPTMVARDGS